MGLMVVCLIAHELIGYLDLKLAMAPRRVTIFEPQVYSALEILPFTAMLLVMILHWPQAQALFGIGHESAGFSIGPKQLPPWGEIIPPLFAFSLLAFCRTAKSFCGVGQKTVAISSYASNSLKPPASQLLSGLHGSIFMTLSLPLGSSVIAFTFSTCASPSMPS